jgi:hypothetical protein
MIKINNIYKERFINKNIKRERYRKLLNITYYIIKKNNNLKLKPFYSLDKFSYHSIDFKYPSIMLIDENNICIKQECEFEYNYVKYK